MESASEPPASLMATPVSTVDRRVDSSHCVYICSLIACSPAFANTAAVVAVFPFFII